MTWNKCIIGDLCDSVSITYRGNAEKVVLINTSDVFDGKILNHDFVANDDLKGQFKKTFAENDILYSEIRPANRRFAFVDFCGTKNYIASTKLMVIRPRTDKVRPRFLYAILTAQTVIDELQHLAETRSGTFPQITFNGEVAPIPVSLPSIEEQDAIVSIIDSIDGKIDENRKINHNLQQQAQALYHQMFCSMPHPDWRNGVLSDIAVVVMGQSPDGKSYNEDGIGTVFYQGRAEFGTRFPTQRLFTTEPKRMAQENDVLISVRAPVGDLNVAKEDCCIGRGLGAVRSKDGHQSFVLYTMFALRSQLNVFNGEGTVFGSINRDSLNSLPVIIPPITEINKFEALVAPMDKAIRTNYDEICHLQSLRDALLRWNFKPLNYDLSLHRVKN